MPCSKQPYDSYAVARDIAHRTRSSWGGEKGAVHAYFCESCKAYHVGHNTRKQLQRIPNRPEKRFDWRLIVAEV